jgi:hypothetical protein
VSAETAFAVTVSRLITLCFSPFERNKSEENMTAFKHALRASNDILTREP